MRNMIFLAGLLLSGPVFAVDFVGCDDDSMPLSNTRGPDPGCWTVDPVDLGAFPVPAHEPEVFHAKGPGLVVQIWSGVWGVENPRSGRVLVTGPEGKRFFGARGYKFLDVESSSSWLEFRHWSGAMGCELTVFHLRRQIGRTAPVLEIRTEETDGSGPC